MLMRDLRDFLAACTERRVDGMVTLKRVERYYGRWAVEQGRPQACAKEIVTAMGYAGHRLQLSGGERMFGGIELLPSEFQVATPPRPAATNHHLSSLGLAGLHLEMVTGHVASLAARTAADTTIVGQYADELENQSIARDAFRAELERITGLPAALIERRLAL